MQEQDQGDDMRSPSRRAWLASAGMLRAVLDGHTYETVAAQHRITRTAVERRIKAFAKRLASMARIEGLNSDAVTSVQRLRQHKDAVLAALGRMDEFVPLESQNVFVLRDDEIAAGALRIRGRSHQPLEDLALYYMLFVTGARPLEIARLEVRDYLDARGAVRQSSVMREDVAITGRARPLYFRSARLDDAMDAYLAQRHALRLGVGEEGRYRGLDPHSRLFLSPSGQGFEITPYGKQGQKRFRCRGIQETYRKLFRYCEFEHITALSARHTLVDRLYSRGADEAQVGLLLGIAERSEVRELFPRRRPTLDELTNDLV